MKTISNSWKRFRKTLAEKTTRGALPVGDLEIRVLRSADECARFDELLARKHYLGEGRPVGDYLRQVAVENGRWVGLLAWGPPAYRLKDRDRWIGWTNTQRAERLKLVVQNRRFLLLNPKGQRPNLASAVLARATRELAGQWEQCFGYRPMLAETFTDIEQFEGTCYKASGWEAVGQSAGYARHRAEYYVRHDRPKRLWLKKLQGDAKEILCRTEVAPAQRKAARGNAQGQLPLKSRQMTSLMDAFRKVADPRGFNVRFPLPSVLAIIAMALLSGARDISRIFRYGHRLRAAQRKRLGLPLKKNTVFYKVPGYSVYYQVLRRMDPMAFAQTLSDWLQSNQGELPAALAMDGKMIGEIVGVLSLVDHDNGVPRAMIPICKKEGLQAQCEMKSAQTLLEESPALDGKIITADALHTQKETARLIVERGGDYLLQIKGNQPSLLAYARQQTRNQPPFFRKSSRAMDGLKNDVFRLSASSLVKPISPLP